jgi:hypothetical protein
VQSRNLENEKARYRAVENTITMGCNAKEQTATNIKEVFNRNIFVEFGLKIPP